jgi:hypothetical protein
VVTVAETAAISDIRNAFISVAQQVPRFDQAQAVEVALRRQSGVLFELAMQRAQR